MLDEDADMMAAEVQQKLVTELAPEEVYGKPRTPQGSPRNLEDHMSGLTERLSEDDNEGWFSDYITVDGNTLVCRAHYVVFLLIALLAGAGVGALLAVLL